MLATVPRRIGEWTRARWRTGRGRAVLAAIVVLILAVPSGLGLVLATALDDGGDADTPVTRVAALGVMAPLSGDLSADGTSVRNAVALAVDEANESGAIPGWRLELSTRDDLSRPDGGAQAADAFVANDRLIGVVGPLSSLVAKVALPTLSAAGIPVVSPSNADPTLTGAGTDPRTRPYPSYFRLAGTDELQARVAAEYAVRTLGRRRIVVVDGEPRYGTTLGSRFAVRAAALGATITAVHQVQGDGVDGSDLDTIAEAIEQEAPDLVYVATGAAFAGKLRTRLAAAGASIQVMGSDALLQQRYTDDAKSAADGDLITSLLVPPTGLPAAGAFVAAYSERFGGPADDDGSTTPSGTDSTGSSRRHRDDATPTPATRAPAAIHAPADSRARTDSRAPADSRASVDSAAAQRQQAAHDATVELAQRRAEAVPAAAAYAYDAARTIIRAAAAVLPGRPAVDMAARHDVVAAIGRGSFAGVTGPVGFDRWGDTRTPGVVLYTVLGGRFVALTTWT
ncbi:branched-chain amino acid ABC transporter substrate-binding protein [Frankia gtarii]|uniref:branched-chain amino acid ABC transporter substrate-binding protein n=1 Tax=Frankia gtarii TaxID=2950102 RepID=UPI0021C248DE|nr:branched-chain amino acid ABC transporter substrate-binding protein [Frankia gtarii]